jgi:hypothetical protein
MNKIKNNLYIISMTSTQIDPMQIDPMLINKKLELLSNEKLPDEFENCSKENYRHHPLVRQLAVCSDTICHYDWHNTILIYKKYKRCWEDENLNHNQDYELIATNTINYLTKLLRYFYTNIPYKALNSKHFWKMPDDIAIEIMSIIISAEKFLQK